MNPNINITDAMRGNFNFVVSQTQTIEPGVYRHRYPELNYAEMVPLDFGANPFTTSVTYFSLEGAGKADWINGNGHDIPVVNLSMDQFETPVHTAGIGYSYGWEEVGRAAMYGMNLPNEKAMIARRAYEEMVYRVVFEGDTRKGFQGLFNYTGVTAAAVPADGTGSTTTWSTKTPDQVARDVNELLIGVYTGSNTVEMADTLILPAERFQSIATRRMTDSDGTILEFIQRSNVYKAQTGQDLVIRGQRGLLTKGAGSTARMIAYRRAPDVLKMHIPMRHRFLPVQINGLQYEIPGVFRLGGVDIKQPKAVRYADGI